MVKTAKIESFVWIYVAIKLIKGNVEIWQCDSGHSARFTGLTWIRKNFRITDVVYLFIIISDPIQVKFILPLAERDLTGW